MLDMSRDELAELASIAVRTLIDFERGARQPLANNLAAIRSALEGSGVEFTNGDAPGVRLVKPVRGKRGK
jgi:transcriptional regulator with XRE-family HTH domain